MDRTKIEGQDIICGQCFSPMPLYFDADGWIHSCSQCDREWVPDQCGTRRGYQQDGFIGGKTFAILGGV
ncbi:hypothetical protein GYB59_18980, partial [bacterium]|nr:hypothetical protein [bacterium]